MLEEALQNIHPAIFNTDQGSQFTNTELTRCLLEREILISTDGRGRALDNAFIERLWRSIKYEDIYLKDYQSVLQLYHGLEQHFHSYNYERPHSALGMPDTSRFTFIMNTSINYLALISNGKAQLLRRLLLSFPLKNNLTHEAIISSIYWK